MSENINCLKVNAENKECKQSIQEVRQTPPTSPPPSKLERISLNPRYSIGTENLRFGQGYRMTSYTVRFGQGYLTTSYTSRNSVRPEKISVSNFLLL